MHATRAAVLGLALVGLALVAGPPVLAEDYPARPVTIVVPYTPGGSTEILSRIVGQKLEESLGKPVLIENKPGAGTVIGASAVAKSTPDGYTLSMATPTPMAINVAVYKNLPYDPTDLVPLARWPRPRSFSSSIRPCRSIRCRI